MFAIELLLNGCTDFDKGELGQEILGCIEQASEIDYKIVKRMKYVIIFHFGKGRWCLIECKNKIYIRNIYIKALPSFTYTYHFYFRNIEKRWAIE